MAHILDSGVTLCHDDSVKAPEVFRELGPLAGRRRRAIDGIGGIAMTYQPDSAVVFFSRDGNSKRGAEILGQRLGGRLIELKELKPGNGLHALFRMMTKLTGDPFAKITSARCVYLISPIWAGNSVPAMNAFAAGANFTDKDVYIVTFQQSVNLRLSHKVHQHLAGIVTRNHGSVRACYALVGAKMGQFAGEACIQSQIDKVVPQEGLTFEEHQTESLGKEALQENPPQPEPLEDVTSREEALQEIPPQPEPLEDVTSPEEARQENPQQLGPSEDVTWLEETRQENPQQPEPTEEAIPWEETLQETPPQPEPSEDVTSREEALQENSPKLEPLADVIPREETLQGIPPQPEPSDRKSVV
jgi:hypothetical protein